MECIVYMVRIGYEQKPYRRVMMRTYGAEVVASPSPLTQAGRDILARDPDSPGSLSIAISKAVEDAESPATAEAANSAASSSRSCGASCPVHAADRRYHGSAPLVSHLLAAGTIEAEAYHQGEVFESALTFAQCEGTIPAPESAHAIHSVVKHALEAREAGESRVIVFNLSGHGLFDLAAYDSFLTGKMDPMA